MLKATIRPGVVVTGLVVVLVFDLVVGGHYLIIENDGELSYQTPRPWETRPLSTPSNPKKS